MVFNAPKNFKRGKYILGRYRTMDLAIICVLVVLSIFMVVFYLNVFSGKEIIMNLVIVAILMIPMLTAFILFIPMPVYFNVFDFIKSYLFFQKKQKKYKWEGIHMEDVENE